MVAGIARFCAPWFRGTIAGLISGVFLLICPAYGQDKSVSTLERIRQSGTVVIGHRESSLPFSYLSAKGEPIGYSIDLCKQLVQSIGEELGRKLNVKWVPVTSASRIPSVTAGQVDLECGSTTNNLERQKLVAFSPTIFVAGTKLLARRNSAIKSFRDLAGKRLVVISGTTNEKIMRDLLARFKLVANLTVTTDHAAAFALLKSDAVDAYATDDVLLYGLLAQDKQRGDFAVVGEYLSYDPYAVMYAKGNPELTALIQDTFRRIALNGEVERLYTRWFLRELPGPAGGRLNLPMSAELQAMLQAWTSSADANLNSQTQE